MKARLLAFVTCLLCLVLCAGVFVTSAESPPNHAQDVYDSILTHAQGENTTQEWIDSALCAQAGTGAEWYILCLAQSSKDYDFSAYESALLTYLDQNTVPSATTRQKYALVLAAIGSTDAYIGKTADTTVGSLGVMSYAYGLHLTHNGYKTQLSENEIMQEILALQKENGGWAISGTTADVDVTAMVLQALAPHYGKDAEVTAAVDTALSMLSARQQSDGGFVSYGVPNPESASQVIMALCALGIDPVTDPLFIKNDNTAFDAIATFSLGDGSYAHQAGGAYSASATAQVLCAMTSYLRFSEGKAPLYDLDHARPDELQSAKQESESHTEIPAQGDHNELSYKPIACAIVLTLGSIACIVLLILKKKHFKNFIAIGIAVALLLAAVIWIDVRLPEDYYHGEFESKPDAIGTVTLTIRCDAVPDLAEIDHLPDDGIILATTTIDLAKGETAYDILMQAARALHLHVDTTGAGEAAYVRGISYLYEQEHGDLSGWTYKVNDISPSVGCGAYTLSDGDEVVFEYTLTVGQ
ncbi:MAG: DUF4430 domain-containing protein [Ruminococcaceae bacterium]|nr:DUF4430 domain-containing protein [Oscillospiraceae bacterium]